MYTPYIFLLHRVKCPALSSLPVQELCFPGHETLQKIKKWMFLVWGYRDVCACQTYEQMQNENL